MTLNYLILKNLTRHKLRTVLTGLAVAIPMMVFVMAIGIANLFNATLTDAASQLRLAVQHRVTFTNFLPDPHRAAIEALDPTGEKIIGVCAMRWFGGQVPDKPVTIPSLAADPDTLPMAYADAILSKDELSAWNKTKDPLTSAEAVARVPYLTDTTRRQLTAWFENLNAAFVEKSTADYYGWKEGELRRMKGSVPPFAELEFKIVKVFDNPTYAQLVFFRKDFLQRTYEKINERTGLGIPDTGTNIFWVKCTSADAMGEIAKMIDDRFATTPDQTKTITESAFNQQFVEGQGNIPVLLMIVGCVVVAVIGLAAASAMSLTFRERIRELAALKAIGFSAGRIFRLVLGEGVLLALLAGTLGALAPPLVFNTGLFRAVVLATASEPAPAPSAAAAAASGAKAANIAADSPAARQVNMILDFISKLSIPWSSVAIAVVISALAGVVAAVVPAFQAMRLHTVTALRYVA